jgi:hypothetical protein
MKTMRLLNKVILTRQADKEGKLQDVPVQVLSKDLLTTAIQNYPDAMRGIQNVMTSIKVLDKIAAADDEVVLEDAEWMLVYNSLNAMTWGPIMAKFIEFFEEVNLVSKGT